MAPFLYGRYFNKYVGQKEKNYFCIYKNIKILNKILIAYEPVWAIGSGKSATADDISLINSEINSHMNKLGYNDDEFYILNHFFIIKPWHGRTFC